ncbi:sugar ABC transporter substrate-binding protein [Raineyella sp. W15-4]|uniref:ABC transporter substrate-binding protein n=1 Tax=Raineyella sp. W15-4 TaxID=3081651 RepID=UPI002952E1CE|nr:sugar ABC transporter substrate-binding protein [Raineyella sp. W15-4]WOQ15918.1 sugar ABC transporter substrate-binding protein [Raineyella sp. W15-4]
MIIRRSRRLAAIAAVAVLATMVTACGTGSTGSGAGASQSQSIPEAGVDDGTTLTMWSRAPLEAQAKHAVEAYNSTHKNQVSLELLPNDDVEGKVGAALQTNTLPDILAGDVVRVPYWAQQGIFQDLTTEINGLPNKADLQQGHIDAGTVNGAEYTLPFVTDISVMVWNKDLYKQAGLDPDKGPSTVQEFHDQAAAVAKLNKSGVAGTYVPGQSGGALVFQLFPMLWGNGEQVLSQDGKQSLMASDSAKKIYTVYRDLASAPNGVGAGSKEETGATWTAPFQDGKIGVMPYPYTAVSSLFKNSPFDVGVAPIPGVNGGSSTFLGGDAIGVTRSSSHVAQAWNFMAWLMTEDAQQKVFADNNDTASNLKVLESGYSKADPRTVVANSTIKTGRTPVSVNFNEAFNAAGSPWQLLIQHAIWGDGSTVDADNTAITTVLGQ